MPGAVTFAHPSACKQAPELAPTHHLPVRGCMHRADCSWCASGLLPSLLLHCAPLASCHIFMPIQHAIQGLHVDQWNNASKHFGNHSLVRCCIRGHQQISLERPQQVLYMSRLRSRPLHVHPDAVDALLVRYNAVIYVPYQLERLLDFGFLVCLDSFLVSSWCKAWYQCMPHVLVL